MKSKKTFFNLTNRILIILLLLFIIVSFAVASNFKYISLSNINPKVKLTLTVKCDELLKDPNGYICYSYKAKSPLYNVYVINYKVNLINLKKRLKFKPDDRIPSVYRNPIKCFSHNDYDLGHLEPDADADYNKSILAYTYLMSNIVPQPSFINRKIISNWERIERSLTQLGNVIVITGAVYYKRSYLNKDKKCSLLPKGFYKVFLLYDTYVKHYNPILMLYVNNKRIVSIITNRRRIKDFLLKRKIRILNKKIK